MCFVLCFWVNNEPSVVTRADKPSRRFRFRSGAYAVPNTSTPRRYENDFGLLAAGSRAGGYAIALVLLSEIFLILCHSVSARRESSRRDVPLTPASGRFTARTRSGGSEFKLDPPTRCTGTISEMLFRLYRHLQATHALFSSR